MITLMYFKFLIILKILSAKWDLFSLTIFKDYIIIYILRYIICDFSIKIRYKQF